MCIRDSIDTIMTRITLPGSFFLAIVAILPALAMKFLGIQQAFAYFYGGTSVSYTHLNESGC